MLYVERHGEIIDILQKRTSASVHYLAKELHVSEPTIRRDLHILSQENKIKRTFGGAVINNDNNAEVPLILRESENIQSKEAIVFKATEYIKDDYVIFLDASSTVSGIIKYLPRYSNLTIITNSPKNSLKLAELKIKSFSTGGALLENSIAYVGTSAQNFVSNFNADLFLFSCRGLSEDGTLSDSSIEETEVRKVMMKHSKKNIFLCSSDKMGKKYMYNLCSYEDVDDIICDEDMNFTLRT